MGHYRRKNAPRVRDGDVQFKSNHTLTYHWSQVHLDRYVVDRERPGVGYRHLLRQADLHRFVALLPDWEELSRGVDVLLLAQGDPDALGWYSQGNVAVCAWRRELPGVWCTGFVEEHEPVLERLNVPREERDDGTWLGWDEQTARGFQLMHILLHELGHHHDRMTTRSQARCSRGEPYAEGYALRYADELWKAYFREFGG